MSRSSNLEAGVILHEPDELVVRVHAGTPMTDLSRALADHGQRLRIPTIGTIGGSIASRRNGLYPPDNFGLPNVVLMCVARDGLGREFTAGGRTVKNVSGFDLVRLLVGSWGTLATITEATLRTEPMPPCSRWFRGNDQDGSLRQLFRPATVFSTGQATIVNIEGHPKDVEAQARLLNDYEEMDVPTPEEHLALSPCEPADVAPEGPVLEICRRLKQSFDPNNVLSPMISLLWGIA